MGIDRRHVLSAGMAAMAPGIPAGPSTGPIALAVGPHPLLDDFIWDPDSTPRRHLVTPTRLPDPVITGPEDRCFQPYLTVLRDPKTHRFRCWYGVPESDVQSHVAYMESDDGIRWQRPHQVLKDPARIQFGVSILDEGPEYPDRERRFKYGFYGDGGLMIAVSANGLEWELLRPSRVLEHNHDINNIYWDPIRQHYTANVSVYTTSSSAPSGAGWTGKRRIPHQSHSSDLVHWTLPAPIILPDAKDAGETQFYCVGGMLARGSLLIGFARVLRDDLPAEPFGPRAGLGYSTLIWSRDGRTWQRDRSPFLDRNPQSGTWDRAMSWADCQLPVQNEIYLYYGGYRSGHKVERFKERQLGLARFPLDRYSGWEPSTTGQMLRTRVLKPAGSVITLNAHIDGELRARVLDASTRKPRRGCDWEQCRPIRGNWLNAPLRWKQEPRLKNQEVILELQWDRGRLFALGVSDRPGDSIRVT